MTNIRVELDFVDGNFTSGINAATQNLQRLNSVFARVGQSAAQSIQPMSAQMRQIIQNGQGLNSFLAQYSAQARNAANASNQAGGAMNAMNAGGRGLLATMRDLSIVAGFASMALGKIAGAGQSWLGDIVKLNAQMERLNFQMRAMSGAEDPIKDAADTILYLQEQAKEMPFALKTITDGFVKMKATGIDPMAGGLQALADGVAAAGGTDEQFQRAVLAVSQMSGKGVIQMEELRQQLGEAMPRAVELMARSMGVSMSTMISEIGKGTVEAKPALAAFFAEVQRTYGGQALLMMQTFSGQVQRLKTSVQQLATTGTIKTNFFDGAIRQQLDDLNRFMASDAAVMWRDKLGDALAAGVRGLRAVVDAAISFRSELKTLGAVIITIFGFKTAVAGLQSLMSFMDLTRTRIMAMTAAWTAYGNAAYLANVRAASGASMMTQLGGRLGTIGAVVRSGIAAFTAFAPLIGMAAMAALTAAEYFGILSDKTKEAYEALKEYGSESRRQAQETVNARRKQLEEELEIQEKMLAGLDSQDGIEAETISADISRIKRELATFAEESRGLVAKAADRESQSALDKFRTEFEKRNADVAAGYDQRAVEFSKYWDQLEKTAAEKGESVAEVQQKREQATLEMQRSAYADRLKMIEEYIAQTNAAMNEARSPDERDLQNAANLTARLRFLRSEAASTQKMLDGLREPVVPTVSKNQNEQRLYENGLKNLEKMRAELAGLKEDAEGGMGAVIRLQKELEAGKYGPKSSQVVQNLIRQTVEVKRQIEEQKAANKQIEDQNRLYENAKDRLGKVRSEIQGLIAGFSGMNQEAAELRSLADKGFFGDIEAQKVRELADELENAARAKSELDRLMKGKEKLEADLEANRLRLVERRLELEYKARGDELSDAEKIKIKMEQGYYDGFGPSSPTRAMLEAIVKSFDIQETAAKEVGTALRDDAFGDQTKQKVDLVTSALRTMASVIQGIGQMIGQITFDKFGLPQNFNAGFMNQAATPNALMLAPGEKVGQTRTGIPLSSIASSSGLKADVNAAFAQNFQGFLKDLESTGYKINSLGGYNYRNIAGTGKLSNHAFGDAIDINPDQNPDTGKRNVLVTDMPPNISELAAKWGLEWGGDWNSKKDAMHFEVSDALKKAAMSGATPTPLPEPQQVQSKADQLQQIFTDYDTKFKQTIEQQIAAEKKLAQDEAGQARVDYLNELKAKATDAQRPIEELGQNYGALLDKIRDGGFGPGSSRDVNSAEYAPLLEAAREADRLEKSRNETIQARTQMEGQNKRLVEQQVELQRRAADAMRLIKDPDARVESSEYQRLEQDLNEYVASAKRAYGETSQAAIQAEQFKQSTLRQLRGTESAEMAAKWQKEAAEINRGIQSQSQQRTVALQRAIAEIDREVAAFQGSEQEKVQMVAAAEAKKAALRKQYAAQDPMSAKLQEWGDLQTNLANAGASWMDSLSGGIADLIMGTGDLRSVVQGMLRDIINMGLKYMMSQMLQGMKGGATSATTGKSSKTGAAKTGASKLATGGKVGVAHTGGILGSSPLTQRFVSGSVFKNAAKYHTGGIIGMPKLGMDEVPIIAKKREGIFTPEQMKALGKGGMGGHNIQINSPITVNANGGTPEQNADLARQMRRESEGMMRSLVADEIFKQMRPGNLLNR